MVSVRGALLAGPALARHPGVVLGHRRSVLVLSHMRSYSSLLCHLLGSHPEIDGYGELHQAYERPLDVLRMRARVARSLDGNLSARYVLDKVLHDEYAVAPAFLERPDVRVIFLLREPAETVASILAMAEREPECPPWFSDVGRVTAYYARRVRTLAALAAGMSAQALFLHGPGIVEQTDEVLSATASYLELDAPIASTYRTFKHTGELFWGDTSERIRSGAVVPRREPAPRHALPTETLHELWSAHAECCAAAAAHRVVPARS
jgi:hypothetical protein